MIFFLKWLFIGFAIGFFLFDNKCKNLREKLLEKYNEFYRPAVPYIKNAFYFFTPVAIAIILLFSIIYHIYHFCNSSFFDCIILSTVGFFSLIDFDEYHINGIFKIAAIFEYYLYSILFATLIGFLLNKAMENDKEREWEPIKNEAYREIDTRSKNISQYIATILGYRYTGFDFNEDIDEKVDEGVDSFIKNTKLDSIDKIKLRFKIDNLKNLKNRLKLMSSELSILQMKYQQYIEPEITTNIIKIQTNLNLAEDTISAYIIIPDNKNIKDIVSYLFKAAKFSQKVSEQSKDKITQEI